MLFIQCCIVGLTFFVWIISISEKNLSFDEEERCPCCPDCGELIEDGDDY